jgi:hypothetical protein
MKKTILIFAVLALACGCKVIDTPKGYLRIENPRRYLFKAVSPDGCAFTVTERDNEGVSKLENWQKAVKSQLTRAKGYEFVSEDKLKTVKGSHGWEMVFAVNYHGLDYLYYLAVARWDDNFWGVHKLYVMEAAGEKAYMEKDLPAIKKAARSLRY